MRYSGKERDATGLYYYGYRYYAPWLGRWLNPDPAGMVDGLNLFAMVGNNPVSFRDPDGRMRNVLQGIFGKKKAYEKLPSAHITLDKNRDLGAHPSPQEPVVLPGDIAPFMNPVRVPGGTTYSGPLRFVEENKLPNRLYDDDRTRTILIHGTFTADAPYKGWANPNNASNENIRTQLGGPLEAFLWSGENDSVARTTAATVLRDKIVALHNEGKRANLIGHSHGGNVAMQAISLLPEHVKINQLITLATPILDNYVLSWENVVAKTDFHLHIYGAKDLVAGWFANFHSGTRKGTQRKNPAADDQIQIKGVNNPKGSHSSVYNPRVLQQLKQNKRWRTT